MTDGLCTNCKHYHPRKESCRRWTSLVNGDPCACVDVRFKYGEDRGCFEKQWKFGGETKPGRLLSDAESEQFRSQVQAATPISPMPGGVCERTFSPQTFSQLVFQRLQDDNPQRSKEFFIEQRRWTTQTIKATLETLMEPRGEWIQAGKDAWVYNIRHLGVVGALKKMKEQYGACREIFQAMIQKAMDDG